MRVMRLENWSVGWKGSAYLPPEQMFPVLHGDVDFHERLGCGGSVNVSEPVSIDIDSQIVTTTSGSKYRLGAPSQEWADFLLQFSSYGPIPALIKTFNLRFDLGIATSTVIVDRIGDPLGRDL